MKPRPSIPRLEIRTANPGRHQVEAWRENVAPLWAIEPDDPSGFVGQARVFHLGTSILGQTSVSAHRSWRSPGLIGRMGVDHVLVQYRETGHLWADADGRSVSAAPGDVCLFDMTRPLAAASTDYRGVTMAVPRRLLAAYLSDDVSLHGTVICRSGAAGRIVLAHLRALSAHAERLTPTEAVSAVEGTIGLLAACLASGSESGKGAENDGPVLSVRMRQFIEDHLTSPDLTPGSLGGIFGLSRSALYRCFSHEGGVARYIRRRRLAHAHRALSRTGSDGALQISELSRRLQFGSEAAFAYKFRSEFGMSPREVRNGASIGDAIVGGHTHLDRHGKLFRWVLDLAA